MNCRQCAGIEREFDEKYARKQLDRYQRKGLRKTTRMLVEALRQGPVDGKTLLDIGGGVGAIQLTLLREGLRHATHVDASMAFIQTAREEAARSKLDDLIDFIYGDFVDVAGQLPSADIVTLDRVICCYDDMPTLVDRSASHARSLYGLVYPRDEWWTRAGLAAANWWFRIRQSPMRTFVHAPEEVDAVLRRNGFHRRVHRETAVWRIDLYVRDSGGEAHEPRGGAINSS